MRISVVGIGIALLLLTAVSPATATPTVDRVVAGSATVAFRLTDNAAVANDVFLDRGTATDTIEFHSVAGGAITLTAGALSAGCTLPTSTSVNCPRVVAGREMRMEVLAGPLDDDVTTGATLPVGVDLSGEDGADLLTGGPEDDFVEPGLGLDSPDGGAGSDRISFDDGRAGPVSFGLGPGGGAVDGGEDDIRFEDVTGTPFADTLNGDGAANDIDGLGGGDSVDAASGNDSIDGGLGDDPALVGGPDDDVLIVGGGANHGVNGGAGSDTLSYDDRTVGVTANLATATATDVATLESIENISGSGGNDSLTGNALANFLTGGNGNDSLTAGEGNDSVTGGSGGDSLLLGSGDDEYGAADGETDLVDCAEGNDQGSADSIDTLLGCELPAPPSAAAAAGFDLAAALKKCKKKKSKKARKKCIKRAKKAANG